jgi:hypothetical protein
VVISAGGVSVTYQVLNPELALQAPEQFKAML